jgi:tungstate transport system ATP-binding protein
MTCFSLEGLLKTYGGRKVLDIDRLEIAEGGVHALLGPNGAGKTTLFEILAFLEHPTAGNLRYRSRPVTFSENCLRSLRREVLMVSQNPVMFSTSVFRNVEFGLRIRKVSRAERERKVFEALDLVGMKDFAAAEAHHLSGGETQRLSIARALALAPRVLLCDEPTANVDVENRAVILGLLRQMNRERGMTVLFTTHDRFQAEGLAQNILALDRGRVVEGGDDNIFSGRAGGEGGSLRSILLTGGLTLSSPRSSGPSVEGPVRITVDPRRIGLNGTTPKAGEKVISGRVRQVMEGNGHIRVVVDAGLWFTVAVPPETYRDQGICVGQKVGIVIPPEAVRILP